MAVKPSQQKMLPLIQLDPQEQIERIVEQDAGGEQSMFRIFILWRRCRKGFCFTI